MFGIAVARLIRRLTSRSEGDKVGPLRQADPFAESASYFCLAMTLSLMPA